MRDGNLKDRLCEVDGDGRMLHVGSSLPWPSMRPIHRWHHDAARQEESIPSLAADAARCDREAAPLKRMTLGGRISNRLGRMALDLAAFVKTRPFAYHLTSRNNLKSISESQRIDSAAELILKDGRRELLWHRRLEHVVVRVDGRKVWLRDQSPLYEGNLVLTGDWSFEDLLAGLNGRVFFWPGA